MNTTTIDPEEFLARCRRVQRRGALATIIASTVPGAPVGARLAIHPGGYLESEIADDTIRARLAADLRVAITTGGSTRRHHSARGGTVDAQIEAVIPAPRLFVFGGGELGAAVIDTATRCGWEPISCAAEQDCSEMIETSDRAVAIVIGFGDAQDRKLIERLLSTRIRHVGLSGPRERVEALVAHLDATRPDPRIEAPVCGDASPRVLAQALIAGLNAVVVTPRRVRP